MSTLIKWNAFPELNSLQDQVNRLFEDTFRAGDAPAFREWIPRCDIHESDHALVMEFDPPGVKQEDVDIRVEKDTLTIHGERKPAANVDSYRRVERAYGAFTRVFSLPDFVDREHIEANLTNGVLSLTLAKREETKPKQIQVKVQAA